MSANEIGREAPEMVVLKGLRELRWKVRRPDRAFDALATFINRAALSGSRTGADQAGERR